VAVVRNNTGDVLSLFTSDAPPVDPGDEIEVSDARFAGRAWPKSTWDLVKKPGKDYVDASVDDAHLFVVTPDDTVADLKQQAADQGIDLAGATTKAEITAAIAKGPTTSEESV
jgi:hypothetical protein